MSRVAVTYRVSVRPSDVAAVAEGIALEQSVELPASALHDAEIQANIAGRVAGIRQRGEELFDVDVELAAATMGGDVAQTINMLFGNSSLHAREDRRVSLVGAAMVVLDDVDTRARERFA